MQSDIRVVQVETFKVPTVCRTPLKFGAVVVDALPIGYARATVENRAGRRATGWGAMFIMDLWAWPGQPGSHEPRARAMCDLFDAYAGLIVGQKRFAHPIEIFMETEAELRGLAASLSREAAGQEMPYLAALVAASPIDHAVHDAFGNANGIDSYRGYGPEHMSFDLSRYLGDGFRGVYPSQFLRQDYAPLVPVFHLVGGLDVLREKDAPADAPQDGIPNSLEKWVERDGVFCLKVKLRGRDLDWDIARTLEVSRIYHEVRRRARPDLPGQPFLTADTNEQCPTPTYIVEYLEKIRERAPGVYHEILYIEQPTERDLGAHRFNMRPVADLKPVLIDESLTSPEDFRLAMELAWTGIALKSCKCLSSDLLLMPMAELAGVPYAVQDLTNPSISLIESVGLAARTHTIKGVEANSRQFFPAANEPAARVHPGLYEIRDGYARTASMTGTGLGMRIGEIDLAACGLPAT
ncbi:MAG: mandelate racemase/muconate lactonizing enzyme family protein [Planctomycetota bacterium]|nr:mandelate racemase/muconate lactonizing enzyme family protein [Planctomycetota bacterium]